MLNLLLAIYSTLPGKIYAEARVTEREKDCYCFTYKIGDRFVHDSTAAGRMTEAKAGHLSFDILVQKKLKLEKMEKKKEKKKKRRKEISLQSVFQET